MISRSLAVLLAAGFLTCCRATPPDDPPFAPLVRAARIPLYPAHPEERRAGRLFYRGGLVLASDDKRFGGWSDLAVSADGREILSNSDEAHWLRARLTYDSSGDLAGIADGEIADMVNMEGRPMRGKEGDAEGLTLVRPHDLHGEVLISFERNVRVWRYDLSHGFEAKPVNVPIGHWVDVLHDNEQLEAITLWKPDTLLAFAETRVNPGDDLLAALEAYPGDPGHLNTRMLAVAPHGPFAITSVANAPDGGIYLLERRFTLAGGVGMEIRHIGAEEIHPGARMEGEVVANLAYQDANIDNMEGLALRQGPDGRIFLYVISDDDYSSLQRTLLLMFEVR
jgi:hypothetical protein